MRLQTHLRYLNTNSRAPKTFENVFFYAILLISYIEIHQNSIWKLLLLIGRAYQNCYSYSISHSHGERAPIFIENSISLCVCVSLSQWILLYESISIVKYFCCWLSPKHNISIQMQKKNIAKNKSYLNVPFKMLAAENECIWIHFKKSSALSFGLKHLFIFDFCLFSPSIENQSCVIVTVAWLQSIRTIFMIYCTRKWKCNRSKKCYFRFRDCIKLTNEYLSYCNWISLD